MVRGHVALCIATLATVVRSGAAGILEWGRSNHIEVNIPWLPCKFRLGAEFPLPYAHTAVLPVAPWCTRPTGRIERSWGMCCAPVAPCNIKCLKSFASYLERLDNYSADVRNRRPIPANRFDSIFRFAIQKTDIGRGVFGRRLERRV